MTALLLFADGTLKVCEDAPSAAEYVTARLADDSEVALARYLTTWAWRPPLQHPVPVHAVYVAPGLIVPR